MSYRCDICNEIRVGKELTRLAEIRNVNYDRSFLRFDRRERKKVSAYDTTFKGSECVVEERLCEKCYELTEGREPRVSKNVKTVKFIGEKRRFVKTADKTPDFNGLKEKFERR